MFLGIVRKLDKKCNLNFSLEFASAIFLQISLFFTAIFIFIHVAKSLTKFVSRSVENLQIGQKIAIILLLDWIRRGKESANFQKTFSQTSNPSLQGLRSMDGNLNVWTINANQHGKDWISSRYKFRVARVELKEITSLAEITRLTVLRNHPSNLLTSSCSTKDFLIEYSHQIHYMNYS